MSQKKLVHTYVDPSSHPQSVSGVDSSVAYLVEALGLKCIRTICLSLVNFSKVWLTVELPRVVRSDCFLEPFFRRVRSTNLPCEW